MDVTSSLVMRMLMGIVSGTALFILAVSALEESIRALAGRKVKLVLRGTTANPALALLISTLITALLQGSSVVMLLLLSLVGAGVLPLRNALAVMLGANLGTTLDTWMVVAIGFKLQLEWFSIPFLLISGALALFGNSERTSQWSRFSVGLGLFFLSLGLLRGAFIAEAVPAGWISEGWPLLVFTLIGTGLTALIQSSLALTVLAVGAVHGGWLSLAPAAALVLGAEVGTTLKLFFGATDGSVSKQRLAWANLVINVSTALLVLLFIRPMLWVSQSLLGNADEVFVLVMFQTLVNVVSLVLFFPILHPFANWLERTVKGDSLRKSLHLSTHPPSDPELAVELFRTESGAFLQAACAVNLSALRIQSDESLLQLGMDEDHPLVRSLTTHGPLPYEYMKAWQGELQLYYLALRKTGQASHQAEEAERIASAVRNAMHALKSMHDIRENLHELRESTSQVKHDAYKHIRDSAKELFDACLLHLKESKHTDQAALVSLYERINRQYEVALAHFYDEAANASIDSRAFTAVMNLNREMYAAKKAMLFAIRDFLMAPGAGAGFDDLMSLKP